MGQGGTHQDRKSRQGMPKSVRRLEFKMQYYRGENVSWLSELKSTNLLQKTGANAGNVRQ